MAQQQWHTMVAQDVAGGIAKHQIAPGWVTMSPHNHSTSADLLSRGKDHLARRGFTIVVTNLRLDPVALQEVEDLVCGQLSAFFNITDAKKDD